MKSICKFIYYMGFIISTPIVSNASTNNNITYIYIVNHLVTKDNETITSSCDNQNVYINSYNSIENATVTISKNGNIVDTNTNVNITSYSEIPYDVTQYGQGEYTITVSKDTTVLYVVNIIVE